MYISIAPRASQLCRHEGAQALGETRDLGVSSQAPPVAPVPGGSTPRPRSHAWAPLMILLYFIVGNYVVLLFFSPRLFVIFVGVCLFLFKQLEGELDQHGRTRSMSEPERISVTLAGPSM